MSYRLVCPTAHRSVLCSLEQFGSLWKEIRENLYSEYLATSVD